ncbi:MAG: GNAT family N-acetyltransferase [Candidatus Borkfalkiaceae bacterium]|nr:GNAT family N-acetyltransferase [Christensenellaceae bacterium]
MKLRKFTINDIKVLKKYKYPQKSELEILKLIDEWNRGNASGRYFEMFSIVKGNVLVGDFSLFEYEPYCVSCAVEIFEPFKRNGYAAFAIKTGLELAKNRGYESAVAQVFKNNAEALELFKSCGFEPVGEFINPHGHAVFTLKKFI